jgi:hypothetical protein
MPRDSAPSRAAYAFDVLNNNARKKAAPVAEGGCLVRPRL